MKKDSVKDNEIGLKIGMIIVKKVTFSVVIIVFFIIEMIVVEHRNIIKIKTQKSNNIYFQTRGSGKRFEDNRNKKQSNTITKSISFYLIFFK